MPVPQFNRHEEIAHERGFRITRDGEIIGARGEVINTYSKKGYPTFCVGIDGKNKHVTCHRLQAFQKFGDKVFVEGTQVRHLNGDKEDFSWDNIDIGTASENTLDRCPLLRQKIARIGARKKSKLSDEDVVEIRKLKKEGWTLKQLSDKFGPSKGNISDIVNRKLFTYID